MIGRARAVALGAALTAVVIAGCSDDTGLPTLDASVADFPIAATIELGDGGFSPSHLEVEVGDTIRLVNVGDDRHRPATTDSVPWDSGDLLPGEDSQWVFDEPGTHELIDRRLPAVPPGQIVVIEPDPG